MWLTAFRILPITLRCYFHDPIGTGHYYRVLGTINGVVLDSLDDFNLLSNEFDEGTEIDRRLSNCNPILGQNVTVYNWSVLMRVPTIIMKG